VVAYGIGRIVNRQTIEDLRPLMRRLAGDQDEIVRRRTGVALSELSRRDPFHADSIFEDWLASGDLQRLWTAAYALLIAERPRRGDREKLQAIMNADPAAFAEALASALTPGDEAKDTDRTTDARRSLLRLAADAEARDWCADALGTYWASHREGGTRLCERLGALEDESVHGLLIAAYQRMLSETDSLSHFQEIVLTDVRAGGIRRQIVTPAVAMIIDELANDARRVGKVAAAWEAEPDLFERFLRWLRADLGVPPHAAILLLRRGVLEHLCQTPKAMVDCAASWLRDAEARDEARDAIRAICSEPHSRSSILGALAIEYFTSRSEVWQILEAVDSRTSTAVRHLAFDRLLESDPRSFIAFAIQETQDFPQIRAEVLQALAEIAQRRGPAMAAAVRQSITPSARPRILQWLRELIACGGPLKKVADTLWPTRLWLWVQQLFSSS
jgi:hypothetical protein